VDFKSPDGSLVSFLNDIEMSIGDELQTSVDTFDFPQHSSEEMERRYREFTSLVIVDAIAPRIWMVRDCTDTVLYELKRVQAAVQQFNPWNRSGI
jgi:hypothetical protein